MTVWSTLYSMTWKWRSLTVPVSLSSHQLGLIMQAATGLPPDKRSVLLERVAARLALCGRFNDADADVEARIFTRRLHGRIGSARWASSGFLWRRN
jgi:hypothetical protein